MSLQAPELPKFQANLLIVDDAPANLQLLGEMLRRQGFKVRPVPSGELALQAARREPPDLILLDINMPPGMSGYEVCEQLKADEKLRDIPVIFISALNEVMDKVKAFNTGGVDYVTKPFQFEEVDARVGTHLNLRHLQLDLQQRNRQLEDSLKRQRELEKLRDNLVHMIIHDMRSPLMGAMGMLELLEADIQERLSDSERGDFTHVRESVDSLAEMITAILDVSRLESGQMPLKHVPCALATLGQEALVSLGSHSRHCTVAITDSEPPATAFADPDVVRRIFANLLGNALKYTPPRGTVTVQFAYESTRIRVRISDTGPGIPAEHHGLIFAKFGQVEGGRPRSKYSTGLGLTFCKLATEAHGGTIGVESEVGHGSTFWFTLPTEVTV